MTDITGVRGPMQGHLQHLTDEVLHSDGDGVAIVDSLLTDAARMAASDVHCDRDDDGVMVRYRVDGKLHEVARVPSDNARWTMNRLKTLAGVSPTTLFVPEDARFRHELPDGPPVEVRFAVAPAVGGEKVTLRLLYPDRVERRLGDLGISPADRDRCEAWLAGATGMFLGVGPTGSGKTTTVYSLLHALAERGEHIVTVEDPVEYSIRGLTQIQVDPRHDLTFRSGIQAALRHDPDGLFIGEIRDEATARAAIQVAVHGGVVLATLHAADPVAAVSRLRHWGIRNHEIVAALRMVVGQRLVRRLCEACRRRGEVPGRLALWLDGLGVTEESIWRPVGCDQCRGIGYDGRTGIFELWKLDLDDFEWILANTDEHTLRRELADSDDGYRFLIRAGLEHAAAGDTSWDEVRRAAIPVPHAPPFG